MNWSLFPSHSATQSANSADASARTSIDFGAPYREVQPLHRNVMVRVLMPVSMLTTTAIILAVIYTSPPHAHKTLFMVLACCIGLEFSILFAFRQKVTVRDGLITCVLLPLYPWTRRISLEHLASARLTKISPMTDLGGYGLKYSKKFGLAYIITGDSAVALVEDSGRRTLVGSGDPPALLEVIRAHHQRQCPQRDLPETAVPSRITG